MSQLKTRDLSYLRRHVAGGVLTPGDSGYDAARSIWNGAIDRRPAAIARCATAADAAVAVAFARASEMEIAVRGGGHSFAGFSVCDDGLMIDLSGMRDVQVDRHARRAVCGGGATWADVDAATQAHGLAVPGGLISHTGIGGLTLGGGFGWLTRKAGLSADNLLAAEVVLADGRTLRAAADENADLFWALRGGGGNFGVVTRFEYQLHQVGPLVNLGLFFWAAERGGEALRFIREFLKTVPEEMGALVVGLSAPPAPFVPERLRLAPGYALAIVGWGSPEEHAQVIEPIRATMAPAFELVTPLPYTSLQQFLDDNAPWGVHCYDKALYLDDLDDGVINVFTSFLARKQSPLSIVPVFPLGGAYRRPGEADTAFGGSRSAGFIFDIAGQSSSAALYRAEREWVRAFWSALLPYARSAGSYVNFMTEHDEARVRVSYGSEKYARLARIKAEYDPDNLFHLNPNIKPA